MRFIVIAIVLIFMGSNASVAQCEGDTCIDVTTDQENNQVVITVQKGKSGSSSTRAPRAVSTPGLKKPWIPWLPRPASTSKPRPRPTVTSRPRVRSISSSKISDQVKSLLPKGSIITQPLGEVLVQQPVNFMTNTPQIFTTVIIVLGVPITIHLTPIFEWDFGDGNKLTTKLPGAPYPLALIQNTYTTSGEKYVLLTTRWSGFWRAGALGAPINGAITQKLQKRILVRPGAVTYRP
ncbi:MAG: hypothetical protein FGM47_03135 [Candidatus Nanopelagicaceae bacterium]|nr:hypothetical protein [Candidatus Nanopelagicaceae bacterium]